MFFQFCFLYFKKLVAKKYRGIGIALPSASTKVFTNPSLCRNTSLGLTEAEFSNWGFSRSFWELKKALFCSLISKIFFQIILSLIRKIYFRREFELKVKNITLISIYDVHQLPERRCYIECQIKTKKIKKIFIWICNIFEDGNAYCVNLIYFLSLF